MKVLIADDHPLMVDGLCSLLEAQGIEVVGTAGDGKAAFEKALELEPDLVLMDIRMPVWDGLTATRRIIAQRPEMKIVILTNSAEDKDLFEAVKNGASGYLLKVTRGPTFVDALRGLEQGILPFSPGLAEKLLHEFARQNKEEAETLADGESVKMEQGGSDPARLTERQTEVLQLVSSGLTYKEVGAKLGLSEVTIRYHMHEILRLLHLKNRSQAIAYAGKVGLEKKEKG